MFQQSLLGPGDWRSGHTVRLIPPAYVKPFVKRQKNDANDAEAICETVFRPMMRFVAVKSEQTQAAAIVFGTRDLLIRQRTQIINALCEHLSEFGSVVAQGPAHVGKLVMVVSGSRAVFARYGPTGLGVLVDMLATMDERIKFLDKEIAH